MRSTKVLAFSVPPELEREIHRHAASEHRTLSEYLREAIRQYMLLTRFDATQKKVAKRMKAKGISMKDVNKIIDKLRKRS